MSTDYKKRGGGGGGGGLCNLSIKDVKKLNETEMPLER